MSCGCVKKMLYLTALVNSEVRCRFKRLFFLNVVSILTYLVLGFSSGQFFFSFFISAIAFPSQISGNSTRLVGEEAGRVWKELGHLIHKICVEISASLFISHMTLRSLPNIFAPQPPHL